MERVFAGFSKGVFILLVIGILIAAVSGGWGIASLRPAKDFEYLMEHEAKTGMHIKGEVLFTYECFANEETYSKNSDGSRTKGRTAYYYYAIPVSDGMIALEVPADHYSKMEDLLEETIAYLVDGTNPSTKVTVDGCVKKMGADMEELFVEYLESLGYTQAEIADMGDLLVIEQPASMMQMRMIFLFGVLLILLAVVWFVVNCIRYGKTGQESGSPAENLGNKLAEAAANKVKIYLTALIRAAVLIVLFFFCGGGVSGLKKYLSDTSGILFLVVMFVVLAGGTGLYTLRHLTECMEFYEYGIRWRGKNYYFSELGNIGWRTVSHNGWFAREKMDTDNYTFDITYLDRCKKIYNRTYMDQ